MRKLSTFLLLSVFALNGLYAQIWKQNLPQEKVLNGTVTFKDLQKAFYQEYPDDEVPNGKRMVNGTLTKVPGWKLFKRWEYYWENRVDQTTGAFPETDAIDAYNTWLEENPQVIAKSTTGNWQSLGPSSSAGGYDGTGRLNCVSFHPSDVNTYWVGSPSGGVWKTTDDGSTWSVLTDQNDVLGVSDIAVSANYTTDNTLYIATGDRDGGSMSTLGGGNSNDNNSIGVLKSTDGGATWNTTGLTFTVSQNRTVNRLLLDPTNNNVLYAATTVGIYKTTDAGVTWNVLTNLEFVNIQFKPGTPSTIYASNWDGDIYRSTDSGVTFTAELTTENTRVEIAVSANDPTVVYALMGGLDNLGGIYKSTDSGDSYTKVYLGTANFLGYECDGSGTGNQAFYDLCIAADPTNANTVLIGGINTWKSTDGGVTWAINSHWSGTCGGSATTVHADKHALVFQNGTSTLFECNDGGIYKSTNVGTSWANKTNGIAHSQLYRIGVSQTESAATITGLQDNGSKLLNANGAWIEATGGDGMECLIDYTNYQTQFATYVRGQIYRTTDAWVNSTTVHADGGYWVTPFVMDPNDHNIMYAGYDNVEKSTDNGLTWTDVSTMSTTDNLRSLAVAPSNSSYIYTADPNQFWVTTNGGTSWTERTAGLPIASNAITYITVKNDDPNTVWVTLGGYDGNRVYQTVDAGQNWTNISAGLPNLPAFSIVQNKLNTNDVELYIGTDVGVYTKIGTNNWTAFDSGLPNVVVSELEIYYNALNPSDSKLRAATFGRGLWETSMPFTPSCTAPVTQATSFSATAIGDNQMTINWARGSGDKVIVLAHAATAVSASPVNGTSYNANAAFSSGDQIGIGNYVVYDGTGTNVTVTGLNLATTYHFSVLEYNTADNCYLIPGLTGNALTTGTAPCAVCSDVTAAPGDDVTGITKVSFNTINNTSTGAPAYTNNTSTSTTVNQGGTYPITVNVNSGGPYTVNSKVWIDWNQNCDFTDAGEEYDLGNANTQTDGATSLSPLSIVVPAGALPGNTVMRVRTVYDVVPLPCGNQEYSEAEDYTITVVGTSPAPVADFTGTPTTVCVGGSVTFTDASTNTPTAWSWTFGDGGTATTQNPTHTYTTAGTYAVALTATNGGGSNVVTKTDYITVVANANAGTDGTLTICAGSTPSDAELFAQLGGTPDAGGTWTNVGLVYTYTVSASPCSNATATVTVTEQAAPNAGTNGTLTVCAGTMPTEAELFAQLGGTPETGGTWTNVGLVHTYTVSATACANATATVTITEQAAPNAGTNGTLTVCTGTTPTNGELFAQLGGSPDTGGTWTNSGMVYTYTVNAMLPCTVNASSTVTVTLTTLPTASFNIDASGEPVINFTNTSTNGDTYSWDLGDGTTETTTDVSHEYSANNTFTVVLSATNPCGTVTSEQNVTIANVGITSLTNSSIKIFPNPTSSILNVKLPVVNAKVQLVTMEGKVLRTIKTGTSKEITLDIKDIAAGVYNLVIETEDNEQLVVKIFKK